MKKSAEPRWNQTFVYSPVHERDSRERTLELTVWDRAGVAEEESEFLGEVRTGEASVTSFEGQLMSWPKQVVEVESWAVEEEHLNQMTCAALLGVVLAVQVVIGLEKSALMDDQPHWFKLRVSNFASLPQLTASRHLHRRRAPQHGAVAAGRLHCEYTFNI